MLEELDATGKADQLQSRKLKSCCSVLLSFVFILACFSLLFLPGTRVILFHLCGCSLSLHATDNGIVASPFLGCHAWRATGSKGNKMFCHSLF
uniref:Uncharacterized protein n=1 Tax=Anguilla anguilla TaxID=7936 RepID=A0A0E9WP57_ANGAN